MPRPPATSPSYARRRAPLAALAATVLTLAAAFGPAPAATAAPPWLPATELAPPAANSDIAPSVAVAPDGSAVAAFTRREGTFSIVYVAARVPGGSFGPATPLSADGASASDVTAVVDPQGNATVAWLRAGVVQARYRPVGGSFAPVEPLSAADAATVSATAGTNGGAAVAWKGGTGAAQRVYVATRLPGQSAFGASQPASPTLNTTTSGLYATPRVAMDPTGNVAAIWQRNIMYEANRWVIETAIKPAASPTFPTASTTDPRSSTSPGSSAGSADFTVLASGSGRFFAIWDASNGTTSSIEYAERAAGASSWSSRQTLATGPGIANAKAAMNAGETVAVAWPSAGAIAASIRTPGSGFSPPKTVSAVGVDSTNSAVTVAPNGEAVVAWASGSGSAYALFAARRRPGTEGFGETTEVQRGATSPVVRFQGTDVALDDQGNGFLTAARITVGSPTTITPVVAAFDPVAPTVDAVSVPAPVPTGTAAAFSATASDRSGAPTVSWNFGDGTTASGGSVSHAYATPGVYTVTITATDAAGNASSTTRPFQVTLPTTATPPGGTAPGGTPLGSSGRKPALPKVGATATLKVQRLRNGRTRVTSLTLSKLVKGDVVTLTCTPRAAGCRKSVTRKAFTANGTSLSLTKVVRRLTLRPKASLVVKIARKGAAARIITFTTVRRKVPARKERCLVPGAKATTAC